LSTGPGRRPRHLSFAPWRQSLIASRCIRSSGVTTLRHD
jgi:hypothetical protein